MYSNIMFYKIEYSTGLSTKNKALETTVQNLYCIDFRAKLSSPASIYIIINYSCWDLSLVSLEIVFLVSTLVIRDLPRDLNI